MSAFSARVDAQSPLRATVTDACPGARFIKVQPSDSAALARTTAPAVVVLAELRADSIRFTAQPSVAVRVCGDLDSARIVARRNLPEPVVVGEVYRDVYIAVELIGRLKLTDSTSRRPPR